MFTIEHCGSAAIVTPNCDLDVSSRDAFITCLHDLERSTQGRVIVSLLDCAYLDSSALNAIAIAKRTLGTRLVLAVPKVGGVSRIFTITDFANVVPIYASLDEALAA